jgi:hypothetical protein
LTAAEAMKTPIPQCTPLFSIRAAPIDGAARLSNVARHGDATHDDRITFGAEDCERQCASGDAFETDARAVER